MKKTILITGCSSGIGHDAAIALSKRGHHVIASCRKEMDCQRLQVLGIDVVQIDVNKSESIQAGFAKVLEKTSGRLDILINNAGYGQMGALEDIPRDALRQQFETNVFGLLEMSQKAIPLMRHQKNARIINISSILGHVSMPFRGAYNASKYAVEGLSDTLRLELKASGIDVISIVPGPIVSQFRDTCIENSLAKINKDHSYYKTQYERLLGDYKLNKNKSMFTKTTDAVISKLIHAIESKRPKVRYKVTLPAYLLCLLKRCLSTKRLDYFLRYISKKELG
ncbi:MAG: SDR family NAD(P)-dependent oxidoreductase [Legionella sp.]|nr:SDR family NAD(P)-dependent oxidoreductase [Legionella sp.]